MATEVELLSVARRARGRYLFWLAALALALVGLGLGPRSATAQTPLTLATLHVALWPEFDRPGVLVIIDGSLPAGTALPAEVSLRMPAAAGLPNATAYQSADGSLLAASYTTTPAGSDIIVTFSTEALAFRLEYYDPALTVTDGRRTYTFDWTSDYAVTAAAVRVQQPATATEFATLPVLAATGTAEDGLEYYEGSLGSLTAGQAVQVTIGYTKPDDTLTSAVIGAAPAATTAVTPVGTNNTLGALVVAGVGLAAAGVIGFIYWRGRRPARAAEARRRSAPRRHRGQPAAQRAPTAPRPAAPAARPTPPAAAGAAFCTQCGQARQPGDKFCRQCGAPVKA